MADPQETLRHEASGRGWQPSKDGGWTKASADGSEQATVRVMGDEFEARIVRHPTGPSSGPDPEPSHGPQVFSGCVDALDYAEGNLGADLGGPDDAAGSPGAGVVGPAADEPVVPEPNEPA